MELRDFVVTPIILVLVYIVAYWLRPYVTDGVNRKYFIPALTVRIVGAICLGIIYQFYYAGGDTFNYHTLGSRIIWEAFMDDPLRGLTLIFGNLDDGSVYKYGAKILFFRDPASYFVIRIAGFFDLFTFSTYTATAVLFAVCSFVGMWMLFITFYKLYSRRHFGIAIATLFVPSTFFWGGGLLKDTIVIACLGASTFLFHYIFFERKGSWWTILILFFALYTIFSVRVFVLQAFLPAVLFWIVANYFTTIRSVLLRAMTVPFMIAVVVVSAYYAVVKVGESDKKYAVSNIARTAQITAYDIGFYTGRGAGSGYSLEVTDWTPVGMLRGAPAAINVTLFRPYLWEARNPLMLISAMESAFLLLVTLYLILTNLRGVFTGISNPNVLFCFVFSLTFAFAVGISTYNFGTLMRYKIPAVPFYLLALIIMHELSNRKGNNLQEDETELSVT